MASKRCSRLKRKSIKRTLFVLVIGIFSVAPRCAKSPSAVQPSSTVTPLATPSPIITLAPLSFSGQVYRGQTFEQEIGNNLTFRLVYFKGDGEGWDIWVGDKAQPDHDFCRVVTFPFRGRNNLGIYGWDFRNSDNSGPNELEYGPREMRGFRFVLDEADYQIYKGLLNTLMRQYNYSEEDVQYARETMMTGPGIETGVLTITHIELGNLIVGERAWIDYMEFQVELYLPRDF